MTSDAHAVTQQASAVITTIIAERSQSSFSFQTLLEIPAMELTMTIFAT